MARPEEILDKGFQNGTLPDGWYTDTAFPKYSPRKWDCSTGDGVIVPLPHDAWTDLRVEVELDDITPGASAFCGTDSRTALTVILGTDPSYRHQAADGGLVLEYVARPVEVRNRKALVSPVPCSETAPEPARLRSSSYVVVASPSRTAAGHGVPWRRRVVFNWTADRMLAAVDGTEVLSARNLRRSAHAGTLHMGFRGCVVRHVTISGIPDERVSQVRATDSPGRAGPPDPPKSEGTQTARPAATPYLSRKKIPPTPHAIRPEYPLEVTVDFNDDLMACSWTHKTFDALFAELKSWGTRRVSWIDLGRAADRYFDFAPLGIDKHGNETMKNVGDIFATAVEHAHRHGIELIGILKPYDMAIHVSTWPPFSEQAKKHGRISRIGGSAFWATMMAAGNQHLVMARKPPACGPAKYDVWTRLDLVKDNDAPAAITPDDISLIVSDDNETFRPYAGPITRREVIEDYPVYRSTPSGPIPTAQKRRARVFRFEGLVIREPFLAIRVKGDKRSFSNRLCDLVHIFGAGGEETHFTYGISPRRAGHDAQSMLPPGGASGPAVGPQGGFEFDRYPGSPTNAITSGGDGIVTPLALDRGATSFLAFARGKDRGTLAAFSPSFPETRALWMTWVRAMLDAGADGIDIRMGHHHSHFAWIEYGFEQPVRDEMLRRTGVDIWETDDFDYELWRRIRGDAYTQFMREASAVVRGKGKKLIAHTENHLDGAPGTGGGMNMVCDWRQWIREGLVDRITGKSLWPDSSFAREVLALAHGAGIPVTYAPYCNNFFECRRGTNHTGGSPEGCEVPVERLIRWGQSSGYNGFVFYECASALRAKPDGTIGFRANAEPLRAVLKRHFGGG